MFHPNRTTSFLILRTQSVSGALPPQNEICLSVGTPTLINFSQKIRLANAPIVTPRHNRGAWLTARDNPLTMRGGRCR